MSDKTTKTKIFIILLKYLLMNIILLKKYQIKYSKFGVLTVMFKYFYSSTLLHIFIIRLRIQLEILKKKTDFVLIVFAVGNFICDPF